MGFDGKFTTNDRDNKAMVRNDRQRSDAAQGFDFGIETAATLHPPPSG
jgi:hypothetical protein